MYIFDRFLNLICGSILIFFYLNRFKIKSKPPFLFKECTFLNSNKCSDTNLTEHLHNTCSFLETQTANIT